jgi:hypothetical protein
VNIWSKEGPTNIGTDADISIIGLAGLIADVVGFARGFTVIFKIGRDLVQDSGPGFHFHGMPRA